ncbi:hypothetical protein AB9B89_16825, partial [Escherichia coli]
RIPDAPVSGFESDLGSTAGKWLGALVGFLLFCVMMLPLLAFYRLVYIFWAGMMPAFFYAFINKADLKDK